MLAPIVPLLSSATALKTEFSSEEVEPEPIAAYTLILSGSGDSFRLAIVFLPPRLGLFFGVLASIWVYY